MWTLDAVYLHLLSIISEAGTEDSRRRCQHAAVGQDRRGGYWMASDGQRFRVPCMHRGTRIQPDDDRMTADYATFCSLSNVQPFVDSQAKVV